MQKHGSEGRKSNKQVNNLQNMPNFQLLLSANVASLEVLKKAQRTQHDLGNPGKPAIALKTMRGR